jgi:hypothetical protein
VASAQQIKQSFSRRNRTIAGLNILHIFTKEIKTVTQIENIRKNVALETIETHDSYN